MGPLSSAIDVRSRLDEPCSRPLRLHSTRLCHYYHAKPETPQLVLVRCVAVVSLRNIFRTIIHGERGVRLFCAHARMKRHCGNSHLAGSRWKTPPGSSISNKGSISEGQ
ncbi:hypothetical protein GYMLUDRAFT_353572 [Collybiopsis luxurians FD-317 M1]|nr:hypothetical protein GYMLUDRAFT_353572 [Collybiopsis luxurians FD-317 M1]